MCNVLVKFYVDKFVIEMDFKKAEKFHLNIFNKKFTLIPYFYCLL